MEILVTGGAGFLGSHLCKNLLYDGHKVICIDNLQTGNLRNIESLQSHENFTFIDHDITKKIDFFEVDQIYNLACPASPEKYQYDPISTLKTNVIGSLNMLEMAEANNAKILQASTSEIYGDPLEHPQAESYWGNVNPIGIRSCYDEGKRCAETLFFDYQRVTGIEVKVVRIFNTYGPSMDPSDGRVVSNFIMQALRGDPITIYGDGSQTRSFCFQSDLIRGFRCAMDTSIEFTGPVNLGNPQEFTVFELAKKIIDITKSSSVIKFTELPSDDPERRKPDISMAKSKLNWEPQVPLDEGLELTIRYFREFL